MLTHIFLWFIWWIEDYAVPSMAVQCPCHNPAPITVLLSDGSVMHQWSENWSTINFCRLFFFFSPSRIDFPIILLEMGRSKTQDPSPTHSNSSRTQRQFLPDLSHLFQTFKGNKYPRSNIHDLNKKLGSKVNPNQKFVSGVKNWPDPSLA